jgi:hypothetical protein
MLEACCSYFQGLFGTVDRVERFKREIAHRKNNTAKVLTVWTIPIHHFLKKGFLWLKMVDND